MKRKFFVIMLILFVVTLISIYAVYSYRNSIKSSQKINDEYNSYYNKQMLGTELISIINKTIDINHKNNIEKDSSDYYIDNENNSIQIYVNFVYKKETKTKKMEDIEKGGIEEFVQVYSTANFKCTNIEYHTKTKNVKSLTFEEISEDN